MRPLVKAISQFIGETPLHENALTQKNGNKIARMMRVYEKCLKLAKLPAPENRIGWREPDLRAVDLAQFILGELSHDPNVEIAKTLDVSQMKLHVYSEYERLGATIMALPYKLDWNIPINESEKQNAGNKPDRLLAVLQIYNLIELNLAFGVKVYLKDMDLELVPALDEKGNAILDASGKETMRFARPEDNFTRDPQQVYGSIMVLANMVCDVRKTETDWITGAEKPVLPKVIESGA
jgi:hypothetical protein